MKELNLFSGLTDGSEEKTMSSREIAELTGKLHKNVLADCDNLNENYARMGLAEISAGVYTHPNTGNQQHREYLLTREQTFDLMTGYKTDLRIRVNRRWVELEKSNGSFNLPKTKIEALEQLLASEKRNAALEAENAKKAEIIKEQKPAVEFTNAVQGSKSSILIGDLAKLIAQNGIDMGQNRLFEWLRGNDYLISYGSRRNTPMQKYIDMGLFEVKEGVRTNEDGASYTTLTTRVTGKGQVYFVSKFLKMKIENQILNQ